MIQRKKVAATAQPETNHAPKLQSIKPPPKRTFKLSVSWPKLLLGSLAVAIIGGLYLVQLDSFVAASPTEQVTIQAGKSLSALSDNPLLAPYKLLVYVLLHLPGGDLLSVRLASVIITCLSVWLFFVLARRWYGTANSVWITTTFAASGWILQTGRFGAGYCYLILTILALLNMAAWLSSTTNHGRALIGYATISGVALFTPGGLWFVIVTTLLLHRPLLIHSSKAKPKDLALASGILVALLVGLGSSLVQNTTIIAQWIGMPGQLPIASVLCKQAVASVTYFVIKGPVSPETWLAHTPLLDVASSVFLLFGIIFYSRHLRNGRTRLLLGFSIICIALIALNGASALSYAVPMVYLVLGGGVAYVMHQWNRTFPLNPLARATALTLMVGLLMAIVGFHAIRYFVAWHNSPNTVQAYSSSQTQNDGYNKTFNYLIQ
jgi:hypothetical protein